MLEVRSASALRSPYTVTIHDFGVSPEGRLYFAMELLEGEGLDELLARGPLPVADAVTIAVQACRSLGEAHSKGIWHRDIKPANLFLVDSGSGSIHVKLLDFGIAKAQDHPADLTAPGGSFGTPDFSSPEQAMGSDVDHRCDIYALGLVLYEMLSGRRPFTGSAREVLLSHIRDKPRRVDEVNPELAIPGPVADATMWALEKLPGRRPRTMEEWADALERALAGEDAVPAVRPDFDATIAELPGRPVGPAEPSPPVAENEDPFEPPTAPPAELPLPIPPEPDYVVHWEDQEELTVQAVDSRRWPAWVGLAAVAFVAVLLVWSFRDFLDDAAPQHQGVEHRSPAAVAPTSEPDIRPVNSASGTAEKLPTPDSTTASPVALVVTDITEDRATDETGAAALDARPISDTKELADSREPGVGADSAAEAPPMANTDEPILGRATRNHARKKNRRPGNNDGGTVKKTKVTPEHDYGTMEARRGGTTNSAKQGEKPNDPGEDDEYGLIPKQD